MVKDSSLEARNKRLKSQLSQLLLGPWPIYLTFQAQVMPTLLDCCVCVCMCECVYVCTHVHVCVRVCAQSLSCVSLWPHQAPLPMEFSRLEVALRIR